MRSPSAAGRRLRSGTANTRSSLPTVFFFFFSFFFLFFSFLFFSFLLLFFFFFPRYACSLGPPAAHAAYIHRTDPAQMCTCVEYTLSLPLAGTQRPPPTHPHHPHRPRHPLHSPTYLLHTRLRTNPGIGFGYRQPPRHPACRKAGNRDPLLGPTNRIDPVRNSESGETARRRTVREGLDGRPRTGRRPRRTDSANPSVPDRSRLRCHSDSNPHCCDCIAREPA